MISEADTCRKFVEPKLVAAGWDEEPHAFTEQKTFTDGRIHVMGEHARRGPQKRADYLLRYRRDFAIAVVEAKAAHKTAGAGLQQAKEYAEILDLKFAYSTNGHEIIEFDYLTGTERVVETFPAPDDLWRRLAAHRGLTPEAASVVLAPSFPSPGTRPRYYQEIAINRTLEAIGLGTRRMLLTMATGTGKTVVAFQICWKLWSARWNREGAHRRPKILYLADRNILVDDPKDKTFAPFGDARWKIQGEVNKGREIYFATYQAVAEDERRPGLYREYPRDFFDLIVVDECHRGSARDESRWREILAYFEPAYQLGMTATPKRDENADTYRYFGEPLYTYSLRQGIDDGFLAPYRVHRVITDIDASGYRPAPGEVDRYGREVPDREYATADFERVVALQARTEAIAAHLTAYLCETDRFAKTIVFCVDQEHAEAMRRALTNLNADLVRQHPDYVCRVTADEGDIGRAHLGRFQEPEQSTPVILTTSQLLTTGVDAPTVKNVVLARVVNSMIEFKQIIGRGTRVRDDYGKLSFTILDYTGSATERFADPAFDGDPILETAEDLAGGGIRMLREDEAAFFTGEGRPEDRGLWQAEDDLGGPRKYYVDGLQVLIVAHMVHELDPEGNSLRVVKFTDYTAEKVRTLYATGAALREEWSDPRRREDIVVRLLDRGIDFEALAAATGQPDADPFDLLCHVAYGAPLRTRRERADRLRREERAFFERHTPGARAILDDLLDKYAAHGTTQFALPDVLKVPPIAERGTVHEIIQLFGGAERLREAVDEMQALLYAA